MKGRWPNVHDELKKFKEKCNDHDPDSGLNSHKI